MSTRFKRLLLFIACLSAASVQAAPDDEPSLYGETSGVHASRYGRGYEARQGLDARDRVGRIDRPERPERPEQVERPERVERVERIERGHNH